MAIDMILVFNQFTNQGLADCDLFENILENHYEKFKYFYSIIEDMCLDKVQKIHCEEQESGLEIYILFKNKKDRDEFVTKFNKYQSKCSKSYYDEYFELGMKNDANTLNISIENKNISKEEDIYENRFNSD
jgi:hypothetical protein